VLRGAIPATKQHPVGDVPGLAVVLGTCVASGQGAELPEPKGAQRATHKTERACDENAEQWPQIAAGPDDKRSNEPQGEAQGTHQ